MFIGIFGGLPEFFLRESIFRNEAGGEGGIKCGGGGVAASHREGRADGRYAVSHTEPGGLETRCGGFGAGGGETRVWDVPKVFTVPVMRFHGNRLSPGVRPPGTVQVQSTLYFSAMPPFWMREKTMRLTPIFNCGSLLTISFHLTMYPLLESTAARRSL